MPLLAKCKLLHLASLCFSDFCRKMNIRKERIAGIKDVKIFVTKNWYEALDPANLTIDV